MKNSNIYNDHEIITQNNMDPHLSYSLSPAKLTKGSQYLSGDKTCVNSLKIHTETLFKRNKVLEDEQYKLQIKIKQVKENLY